MTGERYEELLADRAIWGLDPEEQAQLDELVSKQGFGPDDSFDDTATAVRMAYFVDDGASAPESLVRGLQAGAAAHFVASNVVSFDQFTRTRGSSRSPVVETTGSPIVEAGSNSAVMPSAGSRWRWIAAAAAVVVAFFAGSNGWFETERTAVQLRLTLIERDGSDIQRIDWTRGDSEFSGGASGDVVWSKGRQEGYMRFAGLPVNDSTQRQYQLWIFDKTRGTEHPIDGGVFDVEEGGEVVIPIDARLFVREALAFVVTVEAPGGVVVSDRSHIVARAGI